MEPLGQNQRQRYVLVEFCRWRYRGEVAVYYCRLVITGDIYVSPFKLKPFMTDLRIIVTGQSAELLAVGLSDLVLQ